MQSLAHRACVWELPFAEKLMLWAVRTWARGFQLETSSETVLFEAFSRVQASRAANLLDAIMVAMVDGRSRTIEINCPCCTGIGDDERVILDVFARCQWQDSDKAWFQLRRFLTTDAACRVSELIHDLSTVLSESAVIFSKPQGMANSDNVN